VCLCLCLMMKVQDKEKSFSTYYEIKYAVRLYNCYWRPIYLSIDATQRDISPLDNKLTWLKDSSLEVHILSRENFQSCITLPTLYNGRWWYSWMYTQPLWKTDIYETLKQCTIYTGCFIMYCGITKNYYRRTVGHVFTKPVQIEGTTQKIFFQ